MTALQTRPRPLGGSDAGKLNELLQRDPVLNCVVAARVRAAPDLNPARLGGQLWGVDGDSSALRAAIYHGGNLIPIGNDPVALAQLADAIASNSRNCSSIVGSASAVRALWQVLSPSWGPARIVRERQPLLLTQALNDVTRDPRIRRVQPSELEAFLPAAVAMFTEELHISPVGRDLGAAYRARVGELIAAGRSFARFDRYGQVEFKAEIGALSAETAQVQGVWVRPDLRGQGLGTAAMAEVVALGLQLAPSVSLYVNEFNTAARRMYDRLGFQYREMLSTVLF